MKKPPRDSRVCTIGTWIASGGLLAYLASMSLGASPCNATLPGLILMVLGLVAVPVGFLLLIVDFVREAAKSASKTH